MHLQHRPIGYWAKLLDGLIEASLDRTLADHGVSRRHWQILNVVSSRPRSSAAVAAEIAPFLTSSTEAAVLLADLEALGWVRSADDVYEMTDGGRDRLRRAEADVSAARREIARSVTREQYDITQATLATMCRNLGWNEAL